MSNPGSALLLSATTTPTVVLFDHSNYDTTMEEIRGLDDVVVSIAIVGSQSGLLAS